MIRLLPHSCYNHYSSRAPVPGLFPAIKPISRRPGWVRMASTANADSHLKFLPDFEEDSSSSSSRGNGSGNMSMTRTKKKVIVVLGATGSGKSRLSIDLATLFPSEIINSDKMQLYTGLDITTNKLPLSQRRGVPHHLLGEFDSLHAEITASDYRRMASAAISDIDSRGKLPVLAGGSNSFIYALLARRFDPVSTVFSRSGFNPEESWELRYNCCFLWVDVSPSVLDAYLAKRVDDMLESGMLEELAHFSGSEGVGSRARAGLVKAIGVPEFAHYFHEFQGRGSGPKPTAGPEGERMGMLEGWRRRREAYEDAVRAIKDNTCQLARRQVRKIQRLREGGWHLQRIDATEVLRAVIAAEHGEEAAARDSGVWERLVLEPSVKIVKRFLEEE